MGENKVISSKTRRFGGFYCGVHDTRPIGKVAVWWPFLATFTLKSDTNVKRFTPQMDVIVN